MVIFNSYIKLPEGNPLTSYDLGHRLDAKVLTKIAIFRQNWPTKYVSKNDHQNSNESFTHFTSGGIVDYNYYSYL